MKLRILSLILILTLSLVPMGQAGVQLSYPTTTYSGFMTAPNTSNAGSASTSLQTFIPKKTGKIKAVYWTTYNATDDVHKAAIYNSSFQRLELSSTSYTTTNATTTYKFDFSSTTEVVAGVTYYVAISSNGSWDSGRYASASGYSTAYQTSVECPVTLTPTGPTVSTTPRTFYVEIYG